MYINIGIKKWIQLYKLRITQIQLIWITLGYQLLDRPSSTKFSVWGGDVGLVFMIGWAGLSWGLGGRDNKFRAEEIGYFRDGSSRGHWGSSKVRWWVEVVVVVVVGLFELEILLLLLAVVSVVEEVVSEGV